MLTFRGTHSRRRSFQLYDGGSLQKIKLTDYPNQFVLFSQISFKELDRGSKGGTMNEKIK